MSWKAVASFCSRCNAVCHDLLEIPSLGLISLEPCRNIQRVQACKHKQRPSNSWKSGQSHLIILNIKRQQTFLRNQAFVRSLPVVWPLLCGEHGCSMNYPCLIIEILCGSGALVHPLGVCLCRRASLFVRTSQAKLVVHFICGSVLDGLQIKR